MKSLIEYVNESSMFDLSDELDKFTNWMSKKMKSAYKDKEIDIEAVRLEGEKKFKEAILDNDFNKYFNACIDSLSVFNEKE